MRKAFAVVAFIFALLFSVMGGALFFELATANFVPTSPTTDPPLISIISPLNKTYENDVLLHLNVTVLDKRYQEIFYVSYILDGQEYVVVRGYRENVMNSQTILEGLTEGAHTLQVTASCRSYYLSNTGGGTLYYRSYGTRSGVVNFTVVYPPQISILSLENKTYETSNIELNFTVNELVSKIEYSLDGQENVTVAGNATLTGLADGLHNVTIYATDTDGNIGTSETVYFTIKPFPTTLVVATTASVTVISVCLIVYFKKRKH
jgi:hypothetical protein